MKKIALLMAIVSIVVMAMAGCSGFKDPNTLYVGVDDTYPPMEYKNEKSVTVGFDIDVANEVAKRIDKKIKFVSTQWKAVFTALNANKFDCIISSVSINEERQKNFLLTKPYIANAQMVVVKKGDTSITKVEDLKDKIVGCQVGTTAEESANTILKKGTKFTLKTYEQVILPFADMDTGRLNAIVVDEVVGQYYIAKSPEKYAEAVSKLTNEPIAVCVKKSNTELFDKIQKALDDMKTDGKMKELSEKWFGKDLVSNIDDNIKSYE